MCNRQAEAYVAFCDKKACGMLQISSIFAIFVEILMFLCVLNQRVYGKQCFWKTYGQTAIGL